MKRHMTRRSATGHGRRRLTLMALWGLVAILVLAASAAGGTRAAATSSATPPPLTKKQLRAAGAKLVAQARAGGPIQLYTSADPVTAQALADAFFKKYGIRMTFTRLTSGPAAARYNAEAQAGTFKADVVMIADQFFFANAFKQGWMLKMDQTTVPNVSTIEKKYRFYGSAGVAISRLDGFVYNTRAVSASDVPKTWEDLIKPRWKGELFGPDVKTVPVNMGMLQLLRVKYGDDFLSSLGKQQFRVVSSMVTGVQLVGAGERDAAFGANKGHVNPLLASAPNAPVNMVRLGGPNFGFVWNAGVSAKSSNPAGGRLFVNWMLSGQGQTIFNTIQGTNSILPQVKIPNVDPVGDKFIAVSTNVSQANQQKILSLLGLG